MALSANDLLEADVEQLDLKSIEALAKYVKNITNCFQ
jgi:hypothetical protein